VSEQTLKYLPLLQTSKTNRPQRKAKSTSVICKLRIYMIREEGDNARTKIKFSFVSRNNSQWKLSVQVSSCNTTIII